MSAPFENFITKWAASGAAERANKDAFLIDLCELLDVPKPNPATGDPEKDTYIFERDALTPHEGGTISVGKIDLYKEGAFILEAKQGSEKDSKKIGTARRETPSWTIAMNKAYGQGLGYAKTFDRPPPFLLVCDIGYCFDVYATFDGSWNYRPFPNAQASRIFLKDIESHADALRKIFKAPMSLDPSLNAARVTREVAAHIAELAKTLETEKNDSKIVAGFLMRCLFTMFAEDVGLLPAGIFTKAIEDFWIPAPASFPIGIRSLWQAMNDGTTFGFIGKLLKFNGGLFANPIALPLNKDQLKLLLEAAKCDWSDVEPAIFGTLLERALDPTERHRLGAHYTPKAYVERLVRPTIEEPIRADWEIVRAEVQSLVEADKIEQARKVVRDFHQKLCQIKVLDPACGSGNFLYVTLDLFKRLEDEVLALLKGLGEGQTLMHMETVRVTPAQFLGIEIKPWAREITELVLWIGYLQWHFRTYGRNLPVPEPVLQDYKNIECRDAVLAYDREELLLDGKSKPVTRWDGKSTKKHPVTGEDVPDDMKTIPVYRYVNPRKAEWPKADFIVGNPPFIGNWRMRSALGDGYTEALRATYPEVPESIDYVMYWWEKAAEIVRRGNAKRFGFITTNSLTQAHARRVLQRHMEAEPPLSLVFAVPDHPWVDSEEGAAVRIAMTVAEAGDRSGLLATVLEETETDEGYVAVSLKTVTGRIHADLKVGSDVVSAVPLSANDGLCSPGVKLHGAGFIVTPEESASLGLGRLPGIEKHIRQYRNGKDIASRPRGVNVIDLFGLREDQVRSKWPTLYQWIFERVKPERDTKATGGTKDSAEYSKQWWLFGKPRQELRKALSGLTRFIATAETSKHRIFVFLDQSTLPDNMLVNIASDDAFFLGVLSSRVHVVWALAAGGRLGVGNDPRYTKSRCFDTYSFPASSEKQRQQVRELGEAVDAHRKARQAEHPDLTITGMYNVLVKLHSGEPLTEKEKIVHERGLVSVLKKIHDDLDAAVFDAYGWPHHLTDEQLLERLVSLNAERAEEERNGLIRWLRPEYQNPEGTKKAAQPKFKGMDGEEEPKAAGPSKAKPTAWPKKLPDQVSAVRDLVLRSSSAWTAKTVAGRFKGIKSPSVEPVLESLGALGLLVSYKTSEGKKWKAARI